MRIKRFIPFIVVLLILMTLITYKIYAPENNLVAEEELFNEEEPDIKEETDIEEELDIKEELDIEEEIVTEEELNIEEETDNPIDETPDIEESEVVFTYNPLSEEVVERIMGISYKENDEIKIEDLAYLQVTHWGFDEKEHIGEIIVNKKVASELVEIFRELYEAKFPIEKMRLIDEYNADDNLSMLDNNSSAFCYREVAGSGKLSNHSYGIAIDINPVQNPYIKNNTILPESGKDFLDRSNVRKGMIVQGDFCYNAFKNRGWTWGGDWNSLKDYQHFEFKLDQ